MTRIKICGNTNIEDVKAAVSYGADALGFIAVPESPRFISGPSYQRLSQAVWSNLAGPFVLPVIVAKAFELDLMENYSPRCLQCYEGGLAVNDHELRLIKAFRVQDERSLKEIERFRGRVHAIFLDAYHKDKLGGAGETFDWNLAVEAKKLTDKPIILAGGLTPENVQDAIAKVRPYAVDVASGVEAEPGRKDHGKLKAFIHAVREWDLKYAD
ncbi:MAG TPA: phosphoribosylanthranilate isomerase [Capsulimonadaceae bacterium]|nr:phosphoribosylanthranilate isomerase [Capsulimonadaceae bacterium]